jgi:hypothetical protein
MGDGGSRVGTAAIDVGAVAGGEGVPAGQALGLGVAVGGVQEGEREESLIDYGGFVL